MLPEQWVTLQQVYQCAIDPDLFAAKIKQAEKWSAELNTGEVFIPFERGRSGPWRLESGNGRKRGGKTERKCGPNGARSWSRN